MPSLIPPVLYGDNRYQYMNPLIRLVEDAGLCFVQGQQTVKNWLYSESLEQWKSALNALASAIESHRATRPEYPTAEQLLGWAVYHRDIVDQARLLPVFTIVSESEFATSTYAFQYLARVRGCRLPLTRREMIEFERVCAMLVSRHDQSITLVPHPERQLQYA